MLFTDKITIAIPVYERKEYFDKALESALNQTIKCQIIVVDNASSHDYFKDKCKEKGIPYYRNDINIGMFPNWNLCFKYAETDFVHLLGDDDFLEDRYIEKFISTLNEYPALDLYFTNFVSREHNGNETAPNIHTLPFGYFNEGRKILEYGVKYKLGFPVISSAIRKSAFTGFYEKFHASNDWVWIYGNAGNLRIYGEQEILYNRGVHSLQDSGNIKTHINCVISIAYIYKKTLSDYFRNDINLRAVALKRALDADYYFLSLIDSENLKDFIKQDNIYSVFFAEELKNDMLLFFYSKIPKILRRLIYSLLRRVKILESI
jgi:glycosyltransferase involved in cell wall biosynthesis